MFIISLLLSLPLGFLIIFILLSSSPPPPLPSFPDKILRKLPARCFPKLGCLVSFYKNRHRLLSWYTELLSESATQTIVVHRLGAPRTVVTANPENVEYILKSNFANFPKGKPFTELLGDFLGLGIFNVDGERWATQRKLASHAFSTRSLREFVVRVLEDQVGNKLIPVLEAAAQSGAVLDMQEVLRRFAFDTICQVSLGTDTDKPSSLDLSAAFDAASALSAMRGVAPVPAVWKLKRLLNVGAERGLGDAVKLVRGCVDDMIRSKKKKTAHGGDDLLSRMLDSGLGDEAVRDMVISFLMAGRDTTSSALTWLFWLLTGHREIEERTVEEALSSTVGAGPGFDDLKGMEFIRACLCEAMRLYPPVVWDSKHAANDDVLPDGTAVGRGDRVTYFPYGMGRMETIWGEDWMEFRPDRWFDGEGEVRNVSPYEFPVFQAGPRVCLGKEMAYVQMKYVVASVVTRFVFEPVRTEHPVFVPMLTSYMAGGFNVRVRRRREEEK